MSENFNFTANGNALIIEQDEDEIRNDIAVELEASHTREALKEEAEMKKFWNEIQNQEEKINGLRSELEEAEHSSIRTPKDISAIEFKLKREERKVEEIVKKMEVYQKEIDKNNEKRRLLARQEEAKRKLEAQQDAQKYSEMVLRGAQGSTSANPNEVAASPNPAMTVAKKGPKLPPAPSSSSIKHSVASNGTSSTFLSARIEVPPPGRGTASRQSTTLPKSMLEYRGGAEILPSLSRVYVTRSEIAAKHFRYEDDSIRENYLARLAKRRKLEMAETMLNYYNNLQRIKKEEEVKVEQLEEINGTAPSFPPPPDTVETKDVGDEQEVKVKIEKDAPPASIKRNASNSANSTAPIKVEKDEEEQKITNTHEVIDVDELMEQDETFGNEIVQNILNKCNGHQREENGNSRTTARGSKANRVKRTSQRKKIKKEEESNFATNSSASDSNEDEDSEEQLLRAKMNEYGLTLPSEDPSQYVDILPVHSSNNNNNANTNMLKLSKSIYEKLLFYQVEGLKWLLLLHLRRQGGILGDEMGLGKTVQIAVLLNTLYTSHQLRGPTLIVVPMTLLRQWVAELHRWAPMMRACILHDSNNTEGGKMDARGRTKNRKKDPKRFKEDLIKEIQGKSNSVVIATYAALRSDLSLLHHAGFHYVILDEGHHISNPDTSITIAAKTFSTPHRLILSGSPIQNSLKELWCLFDFVMPGLLGKTLATFLEEFESPIKESRNIHATQLQLATAVECAKLLQKRIAPFLLRRLKKQVNIHLPEKKERVLRIPLSDEQLYDYIELLASKEVQILFANYLHYPTISGRLNRDGRDSSGSLHSAGRNFQLWNGRMEDQYNFAGGGQHRGKRQYSHWRVESFKVMNQLRQICNHTDIYRLRKGELDPDEDGAIGGKRGRSGKAAGASCSFRSNNPVRLEGSAKLKVLLQMCQEWKREGHRALIFSQTRMMLDIIENLCEEYHFTYVRMDGSTTASHRQELMDMYNQRDDIFLALLTTKVGGIGLNLTGADRVVLFDPDWNPITDLQARERAWRIGQQRNVIIYRLIALGTVEEAILKRQLAKIYVTEKVLSDASLQRFFHLNETFVDHFYLGAVYDSRVPQHRKHILASAHLMLSRDPVADRQAHTEPTESERYNTNTLMEAEEIELPTVSNTNTGTDTPGSPQTQLLQDLVDGKSIDDKGSGDTRATLLARLNASQSLQHVLHSSQSGSSSASPQSKFSLLHEMEKNKEKEKSERMEQKKYYEEEMRRQRLNRKRQQ